MRPVLDAIAAFLLAFLCLALIAVGVGVLVGLGGWCADAVGRLMP